MTGAKGLPWHGPSKASSFLKETNMGNLLRDPRLETVLERLYRKQREQEESWAQPPSEGGAEEEAAKREDEAARLKRFLSDKLVALDRDKAEFCYQLCRSLNARRIVEAGTSYGVSTLYLAAAVRDNARASGGSGVVIGTEYEPMKASAARANFAGAGLSEWIELREGDLRETLKTIEGPVDFMLADIWTDMARPALELVAPHLRLGAAVVCDNTTACRGAYADYFAFLNDPANGFRTMTLPFEGGLEISIRCEPRA
jgi:predicted O-methyltransferase YrrM